MIFLQPIKFVLPVEVQRGNNFQCWFNTTEFTSHGKSSPMGWFGWVILLMVTLGPRLSSKVPSPLLGPLQLGSRRKRRMRGRAQGITVNHGWNRFPPLQHTNHWPDCSHKTDAKHAYKIQKEAKLVISASSTVVT